MIRNDPQDYLLVQLQTLTGLGDAVGHSTFNS